MFVDKTPLAPMQAATLRQRMEHALPGLGLALSAEQIEALLTYLNLISKWTRVYNLTAVRDPDEMLTHHLLDCLAAMLPLAAHFGLVRRHAAGGVVLRGTEPTLPNLAGKVEQEVEQEAEQQVEQEVGQEVGQGVGQKGEQRVGQQGEQQAKQGYRLLDVGSGAGLPGIVIAICFPEVGVTCVDTVAKKAAFIKQVALSLKLPNLTGLPARVESLRTPEIEPFDVICSRAFASLADFTRLSAGALAPAGVWMAMKGKHPQDEIMALSGTVEVFHVEQLKVPTLDADRCIVWMRKRSVANG